MAHTPGPWFRFDDEIVAERGDTHIAQVSLCDGTNPTEWQANMHLIAAAPDLLAALRTLIESDALDSALMDFEALQQARDAITKAEGRG